MYLTFDYAPVASASIGQVHRATLKDGSSVAVKVQRPDIRAVFERDNLLLRAGMKVVLFLRFRSLYFMRDPVRELSTWTLDELDYRREGSYAKLLSDNAVHTPTERIPKIYWDLSAERILTMEFLEGPSVLSYLRALENNDTELLARIGSSGIRSLGLQLERDFEFPERRLPLWGLSRRPASGRICRSFPTTWWVTWISASSRP